MPRPPKHVREALKAAGRWEFDSTPPPFDPVAAFCAAPDDDLPVPGAFNAVFDPTHTPPPAFFENGPLFGEIPEDMEQLFGEELPSPALFQGLSWDGAELTNQVTAAAYVASAIQISVAHCGVGFGTSRLLELTQESVKLPEVLSLWVETLGEFVGPDDRKWFYRDFPSETEAMVRAAKWLLEERFSPSEVRSHYWLPTRVDDGRTAAYVAVALSQYLSDRGFHIPESELCRAVFSGDIPPTVSAIARQLPPEEFNSLKLVFQVYSSDREFLNRFSSGSGSRALGLLGLEWDRPSRRTMCFHIPVLDVAEHVLYMWNNVQPTVEKGLGVTFRTTTFRDLGDPWQVMFVHDRPGGVEISSYYSLTKAVANFRSCFGAPLVYSSVPMRMKATGRIDTRGQRIALLRNHLGL
jgi:hypothetical protein